MFLNYVEFQKNLKQNIRWIKLKVKIKNDNKINLKLINYYLWFSEHSFNE